MSNVLKTRHRPQERKSSSTSSSPARAHPESQPQHPILNLQRAIGNHAVLRLMRHRASGAESAAGPGQTNLLDRMLPAVVMQAKLAIGAPSDAYEQEADRVAEQVMRMPAPETGAAASSGVSPHVQRKCSCDGASDGKCDQCRQEEQTLQRSAAAPAADVHAPPIVHDVLRSPGQPLDPATRAFMEPRLGHDFSGVRVHTDAQAAESARAVSAHAYTVGRDVVFDAGQYAPGTDRGRELLAHELTHVVQQRQGLTNTAPGVTHESEAGAAAGAFTAYAAPVKVRQAGGVGIARAPKDTEIWSVENARKAIAERTLEIRRLNGQMDRLSDQIIKIRLKIMQVAATRGQIGKGEAQLGRVQGFFAEWASNRAIRRLEKEASQLEAKIESLRDQKLSLEEDIAAIRERIGLENELANVDEELEALKKGGGKGGTGSGESGGGSEGEGPGQGSGPTTEGTDGGESAKAGPEGGTASRGPGMNPEVELTPQEELLASLEGLAKSDTVKGVTPMVVLSLFDWKIRKNLQQSEEAKESQDEIVGRRPTDEEIERQRKAGYKYTGITVDGKPQWVWDPDWKIIVQIVFMGLTNPDLSREKGPI